MDLARLLADQALEFASKTPVFEKHQESAADRDLKGLLMAIRSATPTPTRGLKRSWGTGSFSFRIQAGTASFITIALVAALISGARTSRTAYRHAAPSDVFDQIAPQPKGMVPIAAFNQPIQPVPRTGRMHIIRKRADDVMAPLKIVPVSGSPNYYVKLVDWTTQAPMLFFLHRSGEVLSTDVPVGQYELRYASGETWYGEEYLFGPDTGYRKADAQLDFEQEGNKVAGYTIQLIKQIAGNLKEIEITPSEF